MGLIFGLPRCGVRVWIVRWAPRFRKDHVVLAFRHSGIEGRLLEGARFDFHADGLQILSHSVLNVIRDAVALEHEKVECAVILHSAFGVLAGLLEDLRIKKADARIPELSLDSKTHVEG